MGFAGGGIGRHYYGGVGGVGCAGQVGVVHEGDVGLESRAGCKMELAEDCELFWQLLVLGMEGDAQIEHSSDIALRLEVRCWRPGGLSGQQTLRR